MDACVDGGVDRGVGEAGVWQVAGDSGQGKRARDKGWFEKEAKA